MSKVRAMIITNTVCPVKECNRIMYLNIPDGTIHCIDGECDGYLIKYHLPSVEIKKVTDIELQGN